MSMIEKVAKAIARRRAIRLLEAAGSDESHLKDFTVIGADMDDARAAIEAMREPTEAMMLAGWTQQFMNVGATLNEAVELANGKLDREGDVRFLKEGWSSAIDAALSEVKG